jgi:hypothetical protein
MVTPDTPARTPVLATPTNARKLQVISMTKYDQPRRWSTDMRRYLRFEVSNGLLHFDDDA